jgi:MFS family permease
VQRRLLFALLAMGIAQAAVYVARPMTSYRLLGVGADERDVGLVAAAFALLPLFLAIPLGRFSDRRGGAPVLVLGCAVQTVACVLLSIADTPFGLGAASALLGVGHLGLALGTQDVVARESDPEHHDRHFGWLTAGVSLGQLVGPLVGGLLLGERGGSALGDAAGRAMLMAAGIAAAATVCALVSDRSRSVKPVRQHAAAPRGGAVLAIASTIGVPAGIFASIAVLSAADVFTAFMPVLGEQHDIGPRAIGALLALRAAASMAARIGIGTIVRTVGRIRLISLSATGAAVALAAMTLSDDVLVLAVLSAAAGIGLGFGQPLSMTMVVQLVPEHARSTALALRLTGNRLGQVATPAAAGVVAGGAGAGAVFWLLSALLVASAAAVQRPAIALATDRAMPAEPPLD